MRQKLEKPEPRHYYSEGLAQCRNCERLYPPIVGSSGFCVNCTVDAMRRDYLYEIDK